MPALKIAPVPYRPSRLSVPVSPFSPLSPLTPTFTAPKPRKFNGASRCTGHSPHTPPPPNPLRWLWQCHMCHQKYPIGATRRCLEDGHFFCSGTTVVKSSRKGKRNAFKRHQPCASEFDYQGWRGWGEWRRAEQRRYESILRRALLDYDGDTPMSSRSSSGASTPKWGEKDCWEACSYPSECRWGAHIGTPSPLASPRPVIVELKELK